MPASFHIDSVWITHRGAAWASAPSDDRPASAGFPHYEVVVRERPSWEPGGRVDVVARLRIAQGRTLLLVARDQPIHRTE